MDMGIDVLIKKAPVKVEQAIRFMVHLILLALNAYIFYLAIVFTLIAWEKPTAVLGISSAAFNSALIVGFGLRSFLGWIRTRFAHGGRIDDHGYSCFKKTEL